VTATRIQLCGALAVRIAGERVEDRLPGRQGRLLFAHLVCERRRSATRDALTAAIWDEALPEAADAALSALLSKLRKLVPLVGRHELRLDLAEDAWIDTEVAAEALHRAASAASREDWHAAWGPARVVQHITSRPFFASESLPWVTERRRLLEGDLLRALELAALASLRIGGSELDTAERTARRLVQLAPLQESGTRLLMEIHEARGNRADALLAYDALRRGLRDELGVAPSAATQALHRALLD
jgi:DNA-binding SARP family transcriptional activator